MKMFGNIIDWNTERYLSLTLNREAVTEVDGILMQRFKGYVVKGIIAHVELFDYTCPITKYESDE